jgi:hypothetical protein
MLTGAPGIQAALTWMDAIPGRADPLVIELPKGGYVPRFRRIPPSLARLAAELSGSAGSSEKRMSAAVVGGGTGGLRSSRGSWILVS